MSEVLTSSNIRIIKVVFVGAAAICGTGFLVSRLQQWKKRKALKIKGQELKKDLEKRIQLKIKELQHSDVGERNSIFELNAQELIDALQSGKISSEKVLDAYLYKSCFLTQQLNCVIGLIEDANHVASDLSKVEDPRECPLYGLPVSLKESLQTKGMDVTLGLAANIGDTSLEDCVLVKVLKHCGAVPFVKTNLPQMVGSLDSGNPIFGPTFNPQNVNFTAGGSSSGEGSVIAGGGSLLGFGTDTGGSIRCPSHICGISGFKPSLNRISTKGIKGLWGQIGPMARDVDTLVLAMRALLCPLMFKLDINVPPIPFNEKLFASSKKLRIGYYVTDGYCEPAPAIKRSVLLAKEALEKAGHTLVLFQPMNVAELLWMLTATAISVDSKAFLSMLENEEVDPSIQIHVKKVSSPAFLRWIKSFLMGFTFPRIAQDYYFHGGNSSVRQLLQRTGKFEQLKQNFHDAWSQHSLDAMICPPLPVVAGHVGSLSNLTAMMSYTTLYNILNYPAGVLPVTKVNRDDIEALKDYKGHYNDPWDWKIKETCGEESLGVSVGVQCVAQPFRDEVCLRVMKELETLLSC